MKRWIRRTVILLVVFGAACAVAAWRTRGANGKAVAFKTATVARGDLLVTIDASGTLEPEEAVDVGAQVGGQVIAFGTDVAGKTVDYGSQVEQGAVLARIDEALPEADVRQAEAGVASAQAGVTRAEADLEQFRAALAQAEAQATSSQVGIARAEADLAQLKAKRTQAERDWARAQKLGPSEALSQASYDSYQSAHEAAQANVAVGEATLLQARSACDASRSAVAMAQANVAVGGAAVLQAKASLTQAETSLWRAKRNLGYCTITSPVSGVIIDRRVNIGQTVNASMDAPSLFLIARDLHRMRVWVAVNEADVARVYAGQPVTYTVDARPDETFQGTVCKVRLNASMTQNVVTYTVEIATDNPEGRLLPYMTANVRFEVQRRDNVLHVPTAALRWTPGAEQVAPEVRAKVTTPDAAPAGNGGVVAAAPVATTGAAEPAPAADKGYRPGCVWVVDGSTVRPVVVRAGLANGTLTEVEGPELAEGLAVVTGVDAAAKAAGATTNPFAPKLPAPPKGAMPPR